MTKARSISRQKEKKRCRSLLKGVGSQFRQLALGTRSRATMARKLCLEYPATIYHLLNRGDRRQPIVRDDSDRERFLETLAEACAETDGQAHALWCKRPRPIRWPG